jgi:hypothetical protein
MAGCGLEKVSSAQRVASNIDSSLAAVQRAVQADAALAGGNGQEVAELRRIRRAFHARP